MSKETINIDLLIEKEKTRITDEMNNIQSRVFYMYEKGKISKEEFYKLCIKLRQFLIFYSGKNDYIEDILTNRFKLLDIYKGVLDISRDYKIEGYTIPFNDSELKKYFNEFLKYIKCDKFYELLKRKGMIYIPNDTKLMEGFGGYTTHYGKYSYIVYRKIRDEIIFYSGLAHELGHAYSHYVLANCKRIHHGDKIDSEALSALFEKLFLNYLLENSNVDKKEVSERVAATESKYLTSTKKANKILDIIDKPSISYTFEDDDIKYTYRNNENVESMYSNNYAIGSLIADKLLEEDCDYIVSHMSDIIRDIDSSSAEEIIDNYIDCESFYRYIDKHTDGQYIKKKKQA